MCRQPGTTLKLFSRIDRVTLSRLLCDLKTTNATLPEEPTNCCQSGCANCVWVKYAEEMSAIFKDGGAKAQQIILEKVTDPGMKAFLQMELRNLKTKEEPKGD